MTEKTTTTAQALKNKARANAEKILREKYATEFKALVAAEATKLGVEYTFRKTKAERAEEQISRLLADNPELRDRFGLTGTDG